MLKTKWKPAFFEKNEVVIEGVKYVLPGDIYNKLKIISNAINSDNWVESIENLNLVKDSIVISLLKGSNVYVNPDNKHDIGHHNHRF